MTKKQLKLNIDTDIAELFRVTKFKDAHIIAELKTIIDTYLAIKTTSANQDIVYDDKTGLIKTAWCRYHQRFEDASELVIDNREDVKLQTSRNRCIAGTHKLKEAKSAIKRIKEKAQTALLELDIDTATNFAKEAKQLETAIKDTSLFNYEQDNADFINKEAPVKPKRGSKK